MKKESTKTKRSSKSKEPMNKSDQPPCSSTPNSDSKTSSPLMNRALPFSVGEGISICGCDLSMNGSGICVLNLDKNLDIVSCDWLGFTQVKKNQRDNHVIWYTKDDYFSRFKITEMMIEGIIQKVKDCKYAAIEDFAFGAVGMLANIGEFVGQVSWEIWKRNIALRWYGPGISKKHFTGRGNADKVGMWEQFQIVKGIKPDLKDYPVPQTAKGVSPTSDIVDAYALALLLQKELKLRTGILKPSDLNDVDKAVFGKKKKSTILENPFDIRTNFQ